MIKLSREFSRLFLIKKLSCTKMWEVYKKGFLVHLQLEKSLSMNTIQAYGLDLEKLIQFIEIKGEKIPAYKTFEGVPIYTHHKNDDIEQAKGMVVYAEWDEEENCVYCTFFVDEEAYPDIARNIRTGVIHDVSMGCSVDYGICCKCKNKAFTEKDYCECLKKYKGKLIS